MSLEVESRQQLRALSHPVRLRILSLLTGTVMSSAELARELGMSHAAVSFHVRNLAAAGYLELAETRSVRGGQERRYRPVTGGLAQWQSEDARLTVSALSKDLLRRLADTPADNWRLFGDAELWIPPQVWDDVAGRIGRAIGELHEAALAPRTPGSVHVSATALLFAIGQQNPGAAGAGARVPGAPGADPPGADPPGADPPGTGAPATTAPEPGAPATTAPAPGAPKPAGGRP
jgi:DNA-binding transcriptional ArsR family regulator